MGEITTLLAAAGMSRQLFRARHVHVRPLHTLCWIVPVRGPDQAHLARCTLERFNLPHELSRIRSEEHVRHRGTLGTREPPPTDTLRGHPFVAGASKSSHQLKKARSAADLVIKAAPAKAEAPTTKSKRKPGVSRTFMELPNDPCDLPNDHGPRAEVIQMLIDRQQTFLDESRGIQAYRASKPMPSELPASSLTYDKLPPGENLTESQAQYFPRSLAIIKECGGGRDPRFLRDYDDFYRQREAYFQSKACLGSK